MGVEAGVVVCGLGWLTSEYPLGMELDAEWELGGQRILMLPIWG